MIKLGYVYMLSIKRTDYRLPTSLLIKYRKNYTVLTDEQIAGAVVDKDKFKNEYLEDDFSITCNPLSYDFIETEERTVPLYYDYNVEDQGNDYLNNNNYIKDYYNIENKITSDLLYIGYQYYLTADEYNIIDVEVRVLSRTLDLQRMTVTYSIVAPRLISRC
jgi:hypothetical protein